MTRWHLALVGLMCAGLAATARVEAHATAQVRLSFEAPGPVAGTPATVLVQFEPAAGIDEELRHGQVRIVATMTGHAMPPVEVALQSTGAPGSYRGELAFSMAGPWRLWFRAEGAHGVMLGTAGMTVGAEPPSAPVTMVMVVVQQSTGTAGPDAPLPYSPWAVLAGALGLTAGLMSLAAVRKLTVSRRSEPAPSR